MSAERAGETRASAVTSKLGDAYRRRASESDEAGSARTIDWEFWGRKLGELLSDAEISLDWDLSRAPAGLAILKLKKGQLQDRAQIALEDLEERHSARILTTVRSAHDRLLRLGPARPARWEGE